MTNHAVYTITTKQLLRSIFVRMISTHKRFVRVLPYTDHFQLFALSLP